MKLTKSQETALRLFTSGHSLFITGKGGTGKSHLTREIVEWCGRHGKSVLVCAPTGVAAANVGGATLHRAFGPRAGILHPGDRCHEAWRLGRLGRVDVVVIDEISMCRADLFAYVANTLLHLRRGRRQVVAVGDFYQLPPVLTAREREMYTTLWGETLFAFQTAEWDRLGLETVTLQEPMRQTDAAFTAALDNIREGRGEAGVFRACGTPFDPTAITLCGRNDEADRINREAMARLGGKKERLASIDTGRPQPADYPAERELTLCPGARVVMLTNDRKRRWANGTCGTVTAIGSDTISVLVDGNRTPSDVERHKWVIRDLCRDATAATGTEQLVLRERATIEQFPVRLAWAISMHKAQGQTYDRANIDLSSIFDYGQLYVALSRCRSLEGMHIKGEVTQSKAMAHPVVRSFMAGGRMPLWGEARLAFAEDDRYQSGWEDGREYSMLDMEERYQERLDSDPSVRRLSHALMRRRETAALPPEQRNPKGAGRRRGAPTRAIRVLESMADVLSALNDRAKADPEFIKRCEALLS